MPNLHISYRNSLYVNLKLLEKFIREFGNKNLLKIAGVDSIRSRMNKINNSYIDKCILQKNPIIVDLIENYRVVQLDEKTKGFCSSSTILNGNQFSKRILRGIDYT